MSRGKPGIGALVVLAIGLVVLLTSGEGDDGDRSRPDSANATPTQPRPAEPVRATVTRVIDGDTVEVSLPGGATEDVRYIGIDTPESVAPGQPVECYGRRASRLNERLVEGREVRLTFGAERRDRYGRLLAYVHAGPLFVNAEMVRRGVARTLEIAPNTDHAAQLDRLARRAGSTGRGLWGACGT